MTTGYPGKGTRPVGGVSVDRIQYESERISITIADEAITEHVAKANPHPQYGRLATTNTWALDQTFSSSLLFPGSSGDLPLTVGLAWDGFGGGTLLVDPGNIKLVAESNSVEAYDAADDFIGGIYFNKTGAGDGVVQVSGEESVALLSLGAGALGFGTNSVAWGETAYIAANFDTDLFRGAANSLVTNDKFTAMLGLFDSSGQAYSPGNLPPRSALPAAIAYEDEANTFTLLVYANAGLRTTTADVIAWEGNSGRQVSIGNASGNPGIVFGVSGDTRELRHGPSNSIRSENFLQIDNIIQAGDYSTATARVKIGEVGPTSSQAGVDFGGDTNLYRGGAGDLRTDGILRVGGIIDVTGNGFFGTTITLGGDASLARAGAAHLRIMDNNARFTVQDPTNNVRLYMLARDNDVQFGLETGHNLDFMSNSAVWMRMYPSDNMGTSQMGLAIRATDETDTDLGMRRLMIGAPNSAGAGFRTVYVPN